MTQQMSGMAVVEGLVNAFDKVQPFVSVTLPSRPIGAGAEVLPMVVTRESGATCTRILRASEFKVLPEFVGLSNSQKKEAYRNHILSAAGEIKGEVARLIARDDIIVHRANVNKGRNGWSFGARLKDSMGAFKDSAKDASAKERAEEAEKALVAEKARNAALLARLEALEAAAAEAHAAKVAKEAAKVAKEAAKVGKSAK